MPWPCPVPCPLKHPLRLVHRQPKAPRFWYFRNTFDTFHASCVKKKNIPNEGKAERYNAPPNMDLNVEPEEGRLFLGRKRKGKNHLPIINFKIRGPLLNSKLEMVVACFTVDLPWDDSQPKFVHLFIQNASSQKMHGFFLKYFIQLFLG